MDEKGLSIRLVNRSKRVFSKATWESKGKRQSLQDGNREWVTIIASICADGSTLPLGLVFAGKPNTIQQSWVEDLEAGNDSVFITATPSGWSNDEVGLAWLCYDQGAIRKTTLNEQDYATRREELKNCKTGNPSS